MVDYSCDKNTDILIECLSFFILFKVCKEGSAEIDCKDKCFFPFNELNCQSACNCTEKDCDHVKGCKRKSKGILPSLFSDISFFVMNKNYKL